VSKEIKIATSNLAQTTIMGVWGSRNETPNANQFIFALNGRRNESILFTRSTVYYSVESGKESFVFGNDTVKNLLCQPGDDISARESRESSLRIARYYKSFMPETSIWGEPQTATISLGSSFSVSNTNNTSSFDSELDNFEGFKGFTPELLVFPKVLSNIESSIFESYLAIKYGISLEKSYLSGTGTVIWDYQANTAFNNRIAGYGREDLLSFDQKMGTTSYQEAPYYSDSCGSYLANGLYNLSSPCRLLVMGVQPETAFNDGEYVIFGDNNQPINMFNATIPGYVAMQRKWLVRTNSKRPIKNQIELSYYDSLRTELADNLYDIALLINRSVNAGGDPEYDDYDIYFADTIDESRSKIIFRNVVWNVAGNGKDVFTFGYLSSQNASIKQLDYENYVESELDNVDDLRIYYPDPRDLSKVTIRIQHAKPTSTNIMMYDMHGRCVYRSVLTESEGVQYDEIKLPETGVYIIKIITNHRAYSQKVISRK
jgi:hypothetical protein